MEELTRPETGGSAPVVHALTIAGSDSSGGAGIQADLKAFSALGAYGMSALTALTAQNTQGVRSVYGVPGSFLAEQIDAVFEDVRVDAVKIGMLGSVEATRCVAARLQAHRPRYVILDPVMVAKSGHRLIDAEAVAALRDELVPLATLLTPNLPEAGVLLGETPPQDAGGLEAFALELRSLGAGAILLKGGHLVGTEALDVLADVHGARRFAAPRVQTRNTHGTGCTLSSAIAALRPRAPSLDAAVGAAKRYLGDCLAAADTLDVGHGHGPVHHFHALWSADPAAQWLRAPDA